MQRCLFCYAARHCLQAPLAHTFVACWLQCDVTAVGATVCRHYVIAHLLDISTGERYIYACVMLYMLMVNFLSALHAHPLHFHAAGLLASAPPLSDH